MYCLSCGKEIPDQSQYCKFCGSRIKVRKLKSNKKEKNYLAVFSAVFSCIAFLGCLLPLSVFGWRAIILIFSCGVLSLLLGWLGKKRMYHMFASEGIWKFKKVLNASQIIACICILLALASVIG